MNAAGGFNTRRRINFRHARI